MRSLSSAAKLDRLNDLFTTQDDKKLGRGEVDALASWYGGLATRSQNTVRDRMIELYQGSSYQKGQKEWFRQALLKSGMTIQDLEGVDPNTADGFARLSPEAQFDRLRALSGGYDGETRDITPARIPAGARAAIARSVDAFETDFERNHEGGDIDGVEFGDRVYQAVYLGENDQGRAEGLVGYTVELAIYDGHDIDRTLYFNRAGQYLGNEYTGE